MCVDIDIKSCNYAVDNATFAIETLSERVYIFQANFKHQIVDYQSGYRLTFSTVWFHCCSKFVIIEIDFRNRRSFSHDKNSSCVQREVEFSPELCDFSYSSFFILLNIHVYIVRYMTMVSRSFSNSHIKICHLLKTKSKYTISKLDFVDRWIQNVKFSSSSPAIILIKNSAIIE